tara:strand:- start:380 stop:1009 length:630 start_codon:yes stop_codon:yes gene_type:complete
MSFKEGDRVYFQGPNSGKVITGLVVDLKPRIVKNHTGTGLKIALAANQIGKAVKVSVPLDSLYQTRVEAENHGGGISEEEKANRRKLKTQATKAKNAELIKKMGPIKVGDHVFLGKKIGAIHGIFGGDLTITSIENGEALISGFSSGIRDTYHQRLGQVTLLGKIKIKDLKRRKDGVWVGTRFQPLGDETNESFRQMTDLIMGQIMAGE